MHIPKTAGTSVNSFISQLFGNDKSRMVLQVENKQWQVPGFFDKYEFVSGHPRYHHLSAEYDFSRFFKFTVLREPYHRLASFLVWFRTMADPNYPHFEDHSEVQLAISYRLKAIDYASAADWRKFFDNLDPTSLDIFDNYQTRFFIEYPGFFKKVDNSNFEEALETMNGFNLVGLSEELDSTLKVLARHLGADAPTDVPCKNVAKDYAGLDISRPEIRELFEPFVRYDLKLYEIAKERFVDETMAMPS